MNKLLKLNINKLSEDVLNFSNNLSQLLADCGDINYKRTKLCPYKTQISFRDDFCFRLLYSRLSATHLSVCGTINYYNEKSFSKSSYSKSEQNLDVQFYKDVSDNLYKYASQNILNNNHNKIIAIDGFNGMSKLKKNNIPRLEYDTLYTLIYDVTLKCPITIQLGNSYDERLEFSLFMDNYKNLLDNNIFLFDRGYFSHNLLLKMSKTKMKYIMRIEADHNFINKDINVKDHNITLIYNNLEIKSRIVKYNINSNDYYILTNLPKSYTIQNIKDLYNKRWSAEEFIKLIKTNTKADYYYDKSIINLNKTQYANLIATQWKLF